MAFDMVTEQQKEQAAKHSFVAAFFAMQQELPEITKDSVAEIPNRAPTHYANLKTISDAIRPVLVKFGFIWVTKPDVYEGKPVLNWELTHISHGGPDNPQQRNGTYLISGDMAPQKLGAAITYARRYALCAVVGLTPDNEADAEGNPVGKVVGRKPRTPAKTTAPADPDAVPGTPLPGEPVDRMTRPQQGRMFALLAELGVTDLNRGATVNRILGEAGLPTVTSFKEITQDAAKVISDGLSRELLMRTDGAPS